MNQKNKIKDKIEWLEYSSLGKPNATDITATNLRIQKTKVLATITINHIEEGHKEIYYNCEYPIKLFRGII